MTHRGGLHLQISKLLVVSIIAAIAATGALVITLLVGLPSTPPGPPPDGRPPPPPDLKSLAVFPVVTGLFVLTWLAALVVYCRDQILGRISAVEERAEPSADLVAQVRALSDQVTALTSEYGEQRETDGYLKGMRAAAAQPSSQVVIPLRPLPSD